MELGQIARRVICASVAYYQWDDSLMTDVEYDANCRLLADRWDELTPLLQWQLGSPAEIKTSGMHVKVTRAGYFSAREWVKSSTGHYPRTPRRKWTKSKEFNLSYMEAN
jgi:hypothetical protein